MPPPYPLPTCKATSRAPNWDVGDHFGGMEEVWRGYGGGTEGERWGGGRVPAVLSSEKVSICETLAAPEIVPFLT